MFPVNCQQKNQPFRLTLSLSFPLPNALQHRIHPWQPHSPPSKYQKSLSVRSCPVRRLTAVPSGEREESPPVLHEGGLRRRKPIGGRGQVKDVQREASRTLKPDVFFFANIYLPNLLMVPDNGSTFLSGVARASKTQVRKLAVLYNIEFPAQG